MGPRRKRSFQFNGVREFLNQLLVDKPLLPFVIPFLLIVWCIEKWFFSLSNWVPLVVAVWVTVQVTPNSVDSFLSCYCYWFPFMVQCVSLKLWIFLIFGRNCLLNFLFPSSGYGGKRISLLIFLTFLCYYWYCFC